MMMTLNLMMISRVCVRQSRKYYTTHNARIIRYAHNDNAHNETNDTMNNATLHIIDAQHRTIINDDSTSLQIMIACHVLLSIIHDNDINICLCRALLNHNYNESFINEIDLLLFEYCNIHCA